MRFDRQLFRINVTKLVGNFLWASNFKTLPAFKRAHEIGRIDQGIWSACIKPCITSSELHYLEPSALQIKPIDVRDFKLTACRRCQRFCNVDNALIIKIET